MTGFVLIVCVFSLAVLVHGFTDEERIKFRGFHEACQADPATHVDLELLRKSHGQGTVPGLGAHSLCLTKKLGLQKPNGDVDATVIRNRISTVISDQAKINEAAEKCGQQKGTPEETAVHILKCVRDYVGNPRGEQPH